MGYPPAPEPPPGGFPDTPKGRWDAEKFRKALEEWERRRPPEVWGDPRPQVPQEDPQEIKWIDNPGNVAKASQLAAAVALLLALAAGTAYVLSIPASAPATVVIIGVGLMGAGPAEAAPAQEPGPESQPEPAAPEGPAVVIPQENPPAQNAPQNSDPPQHDPPEEEPPEHEPPEE